MRIALILLLTLLFAYNAQAGKLYRWVDEQGKAHYSQTPPPEALENAEERDLPSKKKTAQSDDANNEADVKEDDAVAKEEEKKPLSEKEKMQAAKQKKCNQAKEEAAKLNSNNKLVTPDPENPGKFIEVDDELRKQRLEKFQAYLDTYCQSEPEADSTPEPEPEAE